MLREKVTEWLETDGDATILETPDERWSRARLLWDVQRLTLAADAATALALPNGYELLVWIFGLIFRGQAPLLLNPALPASVRRELADTLGFPCLIDRPGLRLEGPLPPPARREEGSEAARYPVLHLLTSGTTGRPRMAARSAEALIRQTEHLVGAFQLAPGDRVLALPPFFHSYGLEAAVVNAMAAGATLVLPSPAPFGLALADAIDRCQVTHIFANPALVKLLIAARREKPGILASVRRLISAGALLDAATAAAWWESFGFHPAPVYGLTDVGCVAVADGGEPVEAGYVGRLFPGFESRVEDADGRILAAGEEGLLLIRKPYPDLGYPREAEHTAAVFADGWFRTGDLGRVDGDRRVYLSGARSGRINVGGEKIDPGFVENEILKIPGVRECVVYGAAHAVFGQIVRAAVCAEGLSEQELRDALAERLDPVAIPRYIDLDSRPLARTPGGKLSRAWYEEQDRNSGGD